MRNMRAACLGSASGSLMGSGQDHSHLKAWQALEDQFLGGLLHVAVGRRSHFLTK